MPRIPASGEADEGAADPGAGARGARLGLVVHHEQQDVRAVLGIDVTILTVTLGVVLGATFGGVALAFGLGARTTVSNIIGSHYIRQIIRVGQTVRSGSCRERLKRSRRPPSSSGTTRDA